MDIHFTEHEDLETRRTVLSAYTVVGNREIRSRMYISFANYRQNYIDAAYHRLKDEVRQRALIEMRSQQHYENISIPARRIYPELISSELVSIQPIHNIDTEWLANYRFSENKGTRRIQDKVDWKREGF